MQKLAAYIIMGLFAISGVGCNNPKGVLYALNGFQLHIDTAIYELIAAETADIYSYEKWQPTLMYGFKDRKSGAILNFAYDSISQVKYIPFNRRVEILEEKMADVDQRPTNQYPLFCGQNNELKYCFVTDTVNVKPVYFSGVMESETHRQIFFYSYLTSADSIEQERAKLNSIIMATTVMP